MRNTIYQDESFHLEYSEVDGHILVHCTVTKWRPSTLKKGIAVFAEFLNEQERLGQTEVYTITPNPRFVEMLGGKFVFHYNEEYEVYKWDLIQQPGEQLPL